MSGATPHDSVQRSVARCLELEDIECRLRKLRDRLECLCAPINSVARPFVARWGELEHIECGLRELRGRLDRLHAQIEGEVTNAKQRRLEHRAVGETQGRLKDAFEWLEQVKSLLFKRYGGRA